MNALARLFDYNLDALGLGTIDEPEWKMDHPADVRFALRAVADRLGLWGNHGYEAVYLQAFNDIDANALDGGSTYTMTYPDRPPVGAFWSITMYSIPDYYLVANPIGRYSIGDRTPGIHHGDDGSLQLTIGHDEPATRTPGQTGSRHRRGHSASCSASTSRNDRYSRGPMRSSDHPQRVIGRDLAYVTTGARARCLGSPAL